LAKKPKAGQCQKAPQRSIPQKVLRDEGEYLPMDDALVIVDDFSRYTWTLFLESKSDAFSAFKKLARGLKIQGTSVLAQ